MSLTKEIQKSIIQEMNKPLNTIKIEKMINDLAKKSGKTVHIETRFELSDGDDLFFEYDVSCDGCQRIHNNFYDAVADLYQTWHELHASHSMLTIIDMEIK